MFSIDGQLTAGEAQGVQPEIARRQRGRVWIYYGLSILLYATGAIVGAVLAIVINLAVGHELVPPLFLVWVGFIAGAFMYLRYCRPMVVRRFQKNMRHRGFQTTFDLTVCIDADKLSQEFGGVHRAAEWKAVSEVFRSKEYWIFLVLMEPWFAPRRFFSGEKEEFAFLREALSHMSEEARERSSEAVKLVA
jgi:MFS family permease